MARMANDPTLTLDTCGLLCPMPLLRLGRAVRDAHEAGSSDQTFRLLATDRKAKTDIPAYCAEHGLTLIEEWEEEGVYGFIVRYQQDQYLEPIL